VPKWASVVRRVRPQRLEDMSQRFSPSHGSVADSLSALFQRIGRRKLRVRARDWNDPETLPRLARIEEIRSEAIDPDAVMDRIVKLARKELSADGAGVWLFTGNEAFLGAAAGQASNDERLRLALFSTLLTAWRLDNGSLGRLGKPVGSDCGIGSWLVEPLYQGHNIAGVLAAFSFRLDAFAELDSAKLHSFADVLAQALTKAAALHSRESTAPEPAQLLQLIEQMIPGLRRMVGKDESWSDSIGGVGNSDSGVALRSVLNEESAEEMSSSERTVRVEQVDTTWLEADAEPSRSLEVSTIRLDDQADQARSECEAVESCHPGAEANPGLDHVATFIRSCASRALGAARVAGVWIKNRVGFQSQPSLQAVVRTAIVPLVVMGIGFLIFKTDRYVRGHVSESSSSTTTPEQKEQVADENPIDRESPQGDAVAPVAAPQPQVAETTRTAAAMQVSHMQVTDNNARSALRALSQYELVGLRRRALYGDDSAAFLIGMAYEIGHGVRQDCKTAAQWVASAASEGNAVAQYNLGLRYRDGDGVPMNSEAAMKWLQKAAGHQIPGARVALIAVASRQEQGVASHP
jgi:Sel1 repeat